MPDLNEVIDRIHYDNYRGYTNRQGNIAYLDGTPLKRPFSMPWSQRIIALAIVVVAIIIGFVLVNTFVISRWQAVQATEKAITTNLARPASIESIPNMVSLITLDDASVKAALVESGNTMLDLTERDDSHDLTLYRIPPDMTTDDVLAYYMQGLNSLEAVDASKLFQGGWLFAADRTGVTSMVTRYADFTTGDPQVAIQNAILKEGFDTGAITETGEDDSGNTYTSGTFMREDEVTGTWKVSAIPFEDVYSISGLPEKSCYVGIRVTLS